MTSEAAGRLAALAGVLGQAGEGPPTGRELAELLWLARQMEGDGPAGSPAVPEPRPAVVTHGDTTDPAGIRAARRPVPPPVAPPPEPARQLPSPPGTEHRVPLRTPAPPAPRAVPETGAGHTPLLAPAPPMLARPLALQRSLRPLRRTVPSGAERELDEAATADRIAALAAPGSGLRLWLPVLRPRQERWLHLRLVVDSGPTMTMWRPLARELHTAFTQTGAFRTLDVLRLGEDGLLPPRHRERGRTAVLVISDAMGPQWRDGPTGLRWRGALAALAAEGPVALLQPLPERLWRHTAAPAVPGRFMSPAAGVPNTALRFTPYDSPSGAVDGVPLPVLEPTDVWVGNWAALVASPSGAELPGAAAFIHPCGAPAAPDDDALVPEEADPEDLVLRFRALASPQAFRLAAHLAVGSAHLPVMRLVQAAIEEHPEPRHLAEVVLSGMLRAEPDAAPGAYEFRPGVREVLLAALPRTSLVRTAGLLARISAEIESRAGLLPGEFRALAETLNARGGERGAGRPFALVSEESVRLLRGPEQRVPDADTSGLGAVALAAASLLATMSGPGATVELGPAAAETEQPRLIDDRYELLRARSGPGGEELLVLDRVLGHPVLLRFHPHPAPDGFTHWVDTLRNLRHPHLVRIHGGLELDGRCAVVLDESAGGTLRDLFDGLWVRPSPHTAMEWAGMLCSALAKVHDAGLVHGDVRAANIHVPTQPEPGATPLSGPVLGSPALRHSGLQVEDDLHAMGRILYELATGQAPPDDGGDPPPPREVRPDVPLVLEQAVLGLLSGNPAHRHDAVKRMAALHHLPGSASWSFLPRPNYRVFGPVKAWFDRLPEADALVLAPLLLAEGRWLTFDDLLAALPAPTTETDLRDHLARLRANGHPVATSRAAARIVLDGLRFDLAQATRLAGRATAAARSGDGEVSRRLFRAALLLGRETPLADLPGPWAERERTRLASVRRRWETEMDAVTGMTASASRVLALDSAGGGGYDVELFAHILQTRRTSGRTLFTGLPPQEALRHVVVAGDEFWGTLPMRSAGLRLVLAGWEVAEADLVGVAAALPNPGGRLIVAFPRWVERQGRWAFRDQLRPVPGHEHWMWLTVAEEVTDVPPPGGETSAVESPAAKLPAATARERRGLFGRLFGSRRSAGRRKTSGGQDEDDRGPAPGGLPSGEPHERPYGAPYEPPYEPPYGAPYEADDGPSGGHEGA
ncbi:SAV_2336 N-terminal domain-related protein [Streptomyces sp. NPDC127092]|uniref:SAV_2336 N-terminal domain-related protein n=1 Tax=Streptomyces sp. NPDC127092 TaxID=3347135 RepID=UPI003661A7E8